MEDEELIIERRWRYLKDKRVEEINTLVQYTFYTVHDESPLH